MVSTEQPSSYMTTTDILNKIISGEPFSVEEKFGDPYQLTPQAKVIWAMNQLPDITSAMDGIFRRVRIIGLHPIPEESIDLLIKEKIMQEGPGILNWAINGLIRFRQRGKFLIPESIRLASEYYKLHNDLAKQFVEECCDIGPDYREQAQPLFNGYKRWCEENGHSPKSMTKMADEWKRLRFTKSQSNGRVIWRGIKLKESGVIQGNEEKEIIFISNNGKVSTPSIESPTIPGEWYISCTNLN